MMVDIHSHILPQVDDGASDMAEAIAMARLSVADGVRYMFATPHHNPYESLLRSQVAERVAKLQYELDTAKITLTIIPGHEVHLYEGVFEDWDKNLAGPLGQSRYVLAEPDFFYFNQATDDLLAEFTARGYWPILAHPERIVPIQKNLALIEPFLARGGITQLTAGSLLLTPDSPARRVAETMLREGMAHILASDAHNITHRLPGLTKARDAAAKIIGLEKATMMVMTTPMAVVNDEAVF